MTCHPTADNAFGPWAGEECRGGFDFTMLFEESILIIPLLSLFIAFLPIRQLQIMRAEQRVKCSSILWVKLIMASFHAGLQLSILILWARLSTIRYTDTTIAACALAFLVSLGIIPLSFYEHVRSVRPSFTLEIFLLLSLLLETARVRTLWLLDENIVIPIVYTCTFGLKAFMLCLESLPKRNSLLPGSRECSPEELSGTISRAFLVWLYPLLWAGYKRAIRLSDLFILDKGLHIEPLQKQLEDAWEATPDRKASGALLNAWMKALGPALLAPVFPRLCLTGFTFAQPFLVSQAINIAEEPLGKPYDYYGYGLIVAFIFVYFGLAFSTVKYEYRTYRSAVISRASLIPCLFSKTLRLHVSDTDSKAVLTLFNTDIENITRGLIQMHEIWAGILELGLALWLLELQLGVATVMPICVTIAMMIVASAIARPSGIRQAAWIIASQKRVSTTSYIISNMKWIRLSGLTSFAFDLLNNLRIKELRVSERYRTFLALNMLLSSVGPLLITLLTYVTYACLARARDDTLAINQAFTSFSLFVLLVKPLSVTMMALPIFAGAVASIGRIQDYLNRQERSSESGSSHDESPGRSKDEKDSVQGSLPSPMIISANGQLSWSAGAKPVLDFGHVTIRRNSFTVVIGPVGCGKSTLLQLFLGEFPQFQGELHRSYQNAAYCSQEPFIPNRTCRQVIVGGEVYDQQWYSEVVKACALEPDFLQWPHGENSVAGSAGASLSGGQKQRLALARAVYARRELLLLDDSFTGLDNNTENQIFNNLLGTEGLLRKTDHTIVLVTSSIRHADNADHLLILGSDGKADEGSITDLRSHPDAISSLTFKSQDVIQPEIPKGKESKTIIDTKTAAILMQTSQEEIKLNLPTGDSSAYLYYFQSAGWRNIVIFSLCLVGIAFLDTFPTVWLKWWAVANATNPNSDLSKWLGGYGGFVAGSIIAVLLGCWELFIVIISSSGRFFHDKLIQTVSRATSSFFYTVNPGVTVNRFSQDLQLIDMQLPLVAFATVISFAYAIGQTIIMSVASKYIIIAVVGLLVVFYFLQHFYLRTSAQVRFLAIEQKAPLYSQLIEVSKGLPTIRAFGWESQEIEEHRKLLDESQRALYALYCLQRWLILTADIIISVLAVILAALLVSLREQNGAGNTGVALINLLGLSVSIRGILVTWVVLEIVIGNVSRIKSFVMSTKPEGDGEDLNDPPKDWPTQGNIELKDISASYSSTGMAVESLSMAIKHGQKIALCGRSGSGKSSLALALFRMLDLDQGSILIDGLNISHIKHEQVRSSLVAVAQESFIFDGTIRDNLDPFKTNSDEDIQSALAKAHLTTVVEELGGIGSTVSEPSFSNGQRRLLSICRAMLRRGRVIIMDEPTAGLDNETTEVIDNLIASWSDATVIVVLHKLDSIFCYDMVAVLDSGRLVEFDSPQRLSQIQGGLLAEFLGKEGNHGNSTNDSTS